MPTTVQIKFDRPEATYFSGETVSGFVEVNVHKRMKIRAISIQFKGDANARWTEKRSTRRNGDSRRYEDKYYKAYETYFSNKVYFVGGAHGDVLIEPGSHVYAFQCLLPQMLPNSFEGDNGYVRYTAKAVVDRPWKLDPGAREAFTVVTPLDLNMFPECKEPVERVDSKEFTRLWGHSGGSASGPLTMTVRVPRGGYVPGQTIPFQVQVDNTSTVEVRNLRGALTQVVTWHADTHNNTLDTEKRVVDLVFDSPVHGGESKLFAQEMTVPPVPPSHLDNCKIIDLAYLLTVTARVVGAHLNLEVKVPILIGTYPLLGSSLPEKSLSEKSSRGPGLPALSGGSFPIVPPGMPSPDLPPPSYEECLFVGNNIKDANDGDHEYTTGVQNFTPRYPVWSLISSADQDDGHGKH